jgi:membrane associated rhomboid family serine protease
MIPISDVIPTRTAPIATIALIVASAAFVLLYQLGHSASLVANLIGLWLFGWTLEDRLGHARFALLFGATGAVAWLLSTPHSAVAGGAAGVIGGYFILYPKSLVHVLVPLPSPVRELPAVTFLALWFLSQLTLGPFPFVPQLAGFFLGAALSVLMKRPERLKVEWWSPRMNAGRQPAKPRGSAAPTAKTSA